LGSGDRFAADVEVVGVDREATRAICPLRRVGDIRLVLLGNDARRVHRGGETSTWMEISYLAVLGRDVVDGFVVKREDLRA